MKEVEWKAFDGCSRLKAVYVEDGCDVDLALAGIPDSAQVGPLPETSVGDVNIWDLRKQRNLIIPEGVEKIDRRWFYGTAVESVTVPASVMEIEMYAFYECKSLRYVQFQDGSKLEKIGIKCFQHSALEKIAVPKNV